MGSNPILSAKNLRSDDGLDGRELYGSAQTLLSTGVRPCAPAGEDRVLVTGQLVLFGVGGGALTFS